jgi:hypothetical protein
MAKEFRVKNGLLVEGSSSLSGSVRILSGGLQITGSLCAQNMTGSLYGSSSYALTASYVLGASSTASYIEYSNVANKPILLSGSAQISAEISGAFTSVSSSLSNRIFDVEHNIEGINIATSSYISNNQTASLSVLTASFAISSALAISSSYSLNSPGITSVAHDESFLGAGTLADPLLRAVTYTQITLLSGSWSNASQSVASPGVLSTDEITYSPLAYIDATLMGCNGVFMIPATTNILNFSCITTPISDININVKIQKI